MAENFTILKNATKKEKYESLIPLIKELLREEENLIANLGNIAATLKDRMNFFWVGFYLMTSEDELILGPFQGPVACTRIKKGTGVCGTS